MSPPVALDFYSVLLRKAARPARDRLAFAELGSPHTHLLVARGAARAVWRQDACYALQLRRFHPAASDLLDVSAGEGVSLREVYSFTCWSNNAQLDAAEYGLRALCNAAVSDHGRSQAHFWPDSCCGVSCSLVGSDWELACAG
eukprot:8487908-Pyramimonas_sp.AAC.1